MVTSNAVRVSCIRRVPFWESPSSCCSRYDIPIFCGIIPGEVLVFQYFTVYLVDDVQPFLVGHRESVAVVTSSFRSSSRLLLSSIRLYPSDGREFLHGEVRVAHHRIEVGHVNIADVPASAGWSAAFPGAFTRSCTDFSVVVAFPAHNSPF